MLERWATFDCYGTLVDWEGGVRGTLSRLWPESDTDYLLRHFHTIEPLVQEGRSLPYREVGARTLRALAAVEDLPLPADREYDLAESLPNWPVFPDVPAGLQAVRAAGWRIAILSNTDPDLLAASLDRIGVPADLTITAPDAGSYKPAPGHWTTFFARTGVDRAAHVHVAASLFHDIAPCATMGIPAVWINRNAETSPLPRAGELPDLRGLADLLDGLVVEG
jgi:2-haloalkanoic acid dehalogenase type II